MNRVSRKFQVFDHSAKDIPVLGPVSSIIPGSGNTAVKTLPSWGCVLLESLATGLSNNQIIECYGIKK